MVTGRGDRVGVSDGYDIPYIDAVAAEVARHTGDHWWGLIPSYKRLYRIYAVLVLTVGEDVTLEHVHDAWSAWMVDSDRNHKSLVWFKDLSREIQELDRPYAEAIQEAARVFNPKRKGQ